MLYFRTIRKGEVQRPPIVLLHGLFGSLENLGSIARVMASHYTVYSLDLPNHGRSPHIANCTLNTMAEMLVRWMEEQGLKETCVLGHSLGGKVAMELALMCPSRVTKLAVLDIAPVQYSSRHDQVFKGLLAIKPLELVNRAEADDILCEYVPESAVRTFLLKNLVKEGNDFVWRMNLDDLYQNYHHLVSANRSGCYTGETLFLKGGDSDYIKEDYRQDILQRFPRAELKIVSNTGHWLHAEKPELVAKIVVKAFSV